MKFADLKFMRIFLSVLLVLSMTICMHAGVMAQEEDEEEEAPISGGDAVIVDDHIAFRVNADGTTSLVEHELIKIVTPRGKRRFDKVYRPFILPDQSVEVEIARIKKPDGTVIELDREKEITRDARFLEQGEIFKNLMILTLDFEKTQLGDEIEFRLVYNYRKHFVEDYYWSISYTDDEIPISKSTYNVTVTKDWDRLKWSAIGQKDIKPEPVEKKLNNGRELTWVLTNRNAIANEPAGPARRDRSSFIMVSTCPGWSEMSKAYDKAFADYIKPGEDTLKTAGELVKEKETQGEKAYALANFIFKKKNLPISFDPDHVYMAESDVMCGSEALTKLQSNLLFVSMLRAAGLEANPVFIADQKYGAVHSQIASPYQFNHIIANVRIDGKWKLIDATSPFNHSLGLYSGLEGRPMLEIKPGGANLEVTPISAAEDNLERIESQAELAADGSLGVTMKIIETGTKKTFWESLMKVMQSPQVQGVIFSRMISIISPNATLIGFSSDENREKNSLEMEISFMAENYPTSSGSYWIVKMPVLPAQSGKFVQQKPEERIFPVLLGNTSREEKAFTLKIPEGFKVQSMPSRVDLVNDLGFLKVDCIQDGNEIKYDYVFQVNKLEISVKEYGQLKELFEKAARVSREMILLQKPETDSQPTG